MRPDDFAARASDGAARTREAASAKAAAPFAAPFHHGAVESSPAILSSSEAGRLVFDAGSEAEARIASARGEARRCARTRRGSKLTPDLTMSPGFAHEALVTGEARRVARVAPCTRGRMVTDDDARDIVEGGGTLVWCVPVSTARGARASLSGRRYDASSSIFERTEDSEPRDICGHLPYPHHAITIRRTMESPSGQEQAPGAKRQRKGKNTEPPNEDPDFTHCCIYNVSHADLVVWLNGFNQKDDAPSSSLHNLSFMDTKIDTGPNKAGDFVEAKSGRMMLQRSLCRPKFSSQVRSPLAPTKE